MGLEGKIDRLFDGLEDDAAPNFRMAMLGAYITAKAIAITETAGMKRINMKTLIRLAPQLTAAAHYFRLHEGKKDAYRLVKNAVYVALETGMIEGHQNRLNLTMSGSELVHKLMAEEVKYS